MAKRSYGELSDNARAEAQPPKRRRAEERREKQLSGPVTAEAITSARQLQHLLSHSGDPALLRHGIQSLRAFLESIDVNDVSGSEIVKLRPILREYLESQKASHEDGEEIVYMADLMQAWALASQIGQSNNNSLLSAIPSILARLIRTASRIDEFRPYGICLCKTLLQPAQLKLISRNLTANNEFIISPSLRLLTEVVSFDGGSQAKSAYARREFTFKGLGRSLNWTSRLKSSGTKKETVRTTALGFLLANFKFQNAMAKSDLAGQRDIISALFKNIQEDPPDVIVNVLNVLKQELILDEGVQRSAKSRLLNPWALGRLAAFYNYAGSADDGNETGASVEAAAHDFLLFVCTTPGLGVLLPDLGWYPPGSDVHDTEVDKNPEGSQGMGFLEHIGLELDRLEQAKKYQEKILVRNSTLSAFAQGLRPYANILQSQLLLAIFKAAPELVANYYLNKRSFSFEPKLTATWIGYSAFLFSTIQLPIPEYCGRREGFSNRPPPIPIVIESILPQPLSQKALTKCLNQKTKLISFFVVRLLCIAFQKLEATLDTFSRASTQVSILWKQASSKLLEEFCRRCPKMKDIITVFRSIAEEDILQREATARLLALYYRVVPDIALNERFDVSVTLANVLKRIEDGSDTAEDLGMRMVELEHLLYIAQCSPNIRWWNKPESLSLSAFTSVLKLLAKAPAAAPLTQIKTLVQSVVYRTHHLQGETSASPIDALVNSLYPVGYWDPSDAVFEFLDNSIMRYARTSTKYYDDLVSILSEKHDESNDEVGVQSVSLLLITLVEQWPFLSTSGTVIEREKENVARWLARYMAFSFIAQENSRVLRTLCGRLISASRSEECRQVFQTLGSRLHCELSIDIPQGPQISHTDDRSGTSVSSIINIDWQIRISWLDHLSSEFLDVQAETTTFDILLARHIILDSWRRESVSDRIAASLIEKVMRIMEGMILRLRQTDIGGHRLSKAQKLLCESGGLKEIFFHPEVSKKLRRRTLSTRKGYTRLLQLAFDNYKPDLDGIANSFAAGFRHQDTKDSQWHHFIALLEPLIHLIPRDTALVMVSATIDEDCESGEGLSDKSAMLLPICLRKLLANGGVLPEGHWRRLVCLPIRQEAILDPNGALIGCILENISREGVVKALTPDDIGTIFRNVRRGYGSVQVLRSVYSRLLDLPSQGQRAVEVYDSRMNKLFRQLLEDGRADTAVDILDMRLAASTTPHPEKGWQWKEGVTGSQILKAQLQYTSLQDALLEGCKDVKKCRLLEMGVYLFDEIDRSKLVDVFGNYPWDTVTTPLVRLLLALGRTVASTNEQAILKRWFSWACVSITKDLSINPRLSDQLSDICTGVGRAFSSNPIPKTLFDPVLLNALLEAIFRKHIDEPHATLLAASIVSTDTVKDIDFLKFLQIVLSHLRNPLRDRSITSLRPRLNIAYIIGRLFHASPASQANPTTIQQVLALARGSNSVEDSVLESISATYVRTRGKILSNQTASYSFSDEGEDRIFRYVNSKLHVSISPRRLAITISRYPTDKPCHFHGSERLQDFLTNAKNADSIHSDTYSHFFLYKVIADWIHYRDDTVDLYEAIESGCAGFVMMGLCSPDPGGRAIALRILKALGAKLLASKYSEKEGAALLIRALVHTAKGVIDKNRVPTPLAIFAARALIIQADPLHCLYPKVNEFLLLGPTWDLGKVPLFHTTLLRDPTADDCYYQEVSWMLENLVSGLRTVEDLNMYRRNHYFEHLCSMYWSPFLPKTLKVAILDILSAATSIEGGSTTLITRAGMMDWIDAQLHKGKDGDANDVTLRRLAKRLYETCNREHVDAWSLGSMVTRVQMMTE